jgi:V/A-type H+-transporting ATPase subunit I
MEKLDVDANALGLNIAYLTGYCPVDTLGLVKRVAAENGWAVYATEPGPDDTPPTLTRNSKFVSLIKPLFDFIGTIPGYREFDVSPSYLIFFSMFFAMIYGDAAYGSIILVVSAVIGLLIRKKTGTMPAALKLFCWLGFCTIIWGALNGAWFAIPLEILPAPLAGIAVFQNINFAASLQELPAVVQTFFGVNADNLPKNVGKWSQWNVQFLCFCIAIVQLVYAHLKNIKRLVRGGDGGVAVAQAGWLVMMVGLYFLVLNMLLKVNFPPFAIYLIVGGLVVYFIFANQTGGNPLVNVGKSFANFLPTFLNAVGSFADIISYIRLFAVGLAGTAIANSFNQLSHVGSAFEGSVGAIIGKTLAAVVILIFGHGLNMLMNALSVIVHGIRLNLLEYAGNHLSMEWSGYSYKPFAKKAGH